MRSQNQKKYSRRTDLKINKNSQNTCGLYLDIALCSKIVCIKSLNFSGSNQLSHIENLEKSNIKIYRKLLTGIHTERNNTFKDVFSEGNWKTTTIYIRSISNIEKMF